MEIGSLAENYRNLIAPPPIYHGVPNTIIYIPNSSFEFLTPVTPMSSLLQLLVIVAHGSICDDDDGNYTEYQSSSLFYGVSSVR